MLDIRISSTLFIFSSTTFAASTIPTALRTILLRGRHHDKRLPASFAFSHRFTKHDGFSCLPSFHIATPSLMTPLDSAFLAIERSRPADKFLAAHNTAPRCHRIRLHPLFSTFRTVPRPRTGDEFPAAIFANDPFCPFQYLDFFRPAFFRPQDRLLLAED